MLGVIFLTLVSLLLFQLGNWRLFAPTSIIGLFNILFLCAKFFWNQIQNEPLLLSCTEAEVGAATLALSASLVIAILVILVLRALLRTNSINTTIHRRLGRLSDASPLICAFPVMLVSVYLISRNGIEFFNNPVLNRKTIEANGAAYAYAATLAGLLLIGSKLGDAFAARRSDRFLLIATILSIPYIMLSGYASTPLLFIIGPSCSYVIQKRLRLIWLPFVLFPVVLLYATVHNTLRQTWATGDGVRIVDYISNEMHLGDALPKLFNRLDYLEMLSLGYAQFLNDESEGVVRLWEVALQPVPRVIWPTKPYNFSSEMSRRVIPDVVNVVGSTANFNALNEFVRSLGRPLGAVVFGVFFGIVLRFCEVVYQIGIGSSVGRTVYIVVCFPYLWVGYPAGLINDFALPYAVIAAIFLVFMAKTAEVLKS